MFTFIVNHFLGNIPTWVFPFMAGGGLAVFFMAGIASHVPPLKTYAMIAKPIAFVRIFGYNPLIFFVENSKNLLQRLSWNLGPDLSFAATHQPSHYKYKLHL